MNVLRKLSYLLLIYLLSGCSSGLTPPNGIGLTLVTKSTFHCQEDYRYCAISTINKLLTQIEKREYTDIPLHKDCKLTQNTKYLNVGDGFFKEAVTFSKKRFYVDTYAKEAMLFSFLKTNNGANVTFTGRFKIIETTPGNYAISELEIISGLSIFKESMYPEEDPFDLLDINQQLSRNKLISLAHQYFDGIEKTSSNGIPFHNDVLRIENGYVFSFGRFMQEFQMNTLFGMITRVRERHIIADREKGVIMANVIMDHEIGDTKILSTPVTEFFKIDETKKLYIEAIFPTDTYGITSGWERKQQ